MSYGLQISPTTPSKQALPSLKRTARGSAPNGPSTRSFRIASSATIRQRGRRFERRLRHQLQLLRPHPTVKSASRQRPPTPRQRLQQLLHLRIFDELLQPNEFEYLHALRHSNSPRHPLHRGCIRCPPTLLKRPVDASKSKTASSVWFDDQLDNRDAAGAILFGKARSIGPCNRHPSAVIDAASIRRRITHRGAEINKRPLPAAPSHCSRSASSTPPQRKLPKAHSAKDPKGS